MTQLFKNLKYFDPAIRAGLVLSVTCGLLFFSSCKKSNDVEPLILARIDDKVVSVDAFAERYKGFRKQTGFGVPDTYQTRQKILSLFVDEVILINSARKNGVSKDSRSAFELERLEIQELLSLYARENISKKVNVTEAELKRLFQRLQTKVNVRHLFAPTKQMADSLYDALQKGATFEELAKTCFKDETLRNSGGLLGEFTVDEMEPDFEEVAFSLPVGKVSEPVRTSDGYSIIRVESRQTKPMITLQEYAKHREKLATYWQNRMIKKAIRLHSDSLAATLHISFDHSTVSMLLKQFSGKRRHEMEFGEKLESLSLVDSDVGAWTVADFKRHAKFTDPDHQNRIYGIESLQDFITGLIVRNKILELARHAGLDRRKEYRDGIADKWEIYLLTRMEDQLRQEMEAPDDSIKSYFVRHREQFAVPARINLREIVVDTDDKARVVEQELGQGKSFEAVARLHSLRKSTADNGGELGFLTRADFGRWADTVFSLKVGERSGSLIIDSMRVFLECIGKREPAPARLEEVRAEVEKAVRYAMWDGYREKRIAGFRRKVNDLQVWNNRLETLNLINH